MVGMTSDKTTASRIALGCMGFSGVYGKTDDATSVKVIQAAIDRGVTLIDTGDFYGAGHNELLVGEAIAGRRDEVQLSVKFGAQVGPGTAFLGFDGRPAALKSFITYSLVRLRTDYIDIYRPARLDPEVPIEDTVGAIAELIEAGYVRAIGLSEVGVDTIRRAAAVHPIADLQIEYSIASRNPEDSIFPLLHELGIGATIYGVLSRGLLSGSEVSAGDFRAHMPRFEAANQEKNQALVGKLRDLAGAWGVSPAQLAIAWVLAKEPNFTPTLGMRTLKQVDEALTTKALTAQQVVEVEKAFPRGAVAGTRYPKPHMAALDSEA